MATNREMLKEAIAEAKAVKEMAIANAKAAIEESFTPQLKSILSAKLQEMEEEEEMEENLDEAGFGKAREEGDEGFSSMREKSLDEEELEEDLDLNELLGELNEEESEEESEEEESEEESEEEGEPIDLEDMTDEDLKKMIEDVIADMVAAGELEAGHEGEGEEEEEMEMEPEAEEEEEINLDELLAEIEDLDEDMEEEGMMYDEDMMDENMEEEELEEGLGGFFANLLKGVEQKWLESTHPEEFKAIQAETDKAKKAEMAKPIIQAFMKEMEAAGVAGSAKAAKINELRRVLGIGGAAKGLSGSGFASMSETTELEEELKEAYTTIETLRSELNEVNLLNAKLLYTNKIFKAKTLTENQKLNVLSSFDKALTVKEVKLVYETLSEGLKTKSTKITENFGSASKPVGTPSTKQPIVESDDMVKRFQKLAGII